MQNTEDTQVAVLMGGLGTRLGLKDIPKAMADVHGRPFFDYQLRLLKRWGFRKFLFLTGYGAEHIEKYYGDGSGWQMDIRYSSDGEKQLGTGGAVKNAEEKLEDDFLLIYGDSFMDIDYQEIVYRYHMEKEAGKSGLMAILRNDSRYGRSNVHYEDGQLLLYDKKNIVEGMHYIDYGVSMLQKKVFDGRKTNEKFDLAEVLTELSQNGRLAAQEVSKRFYEIGSQASLQEFRDYAKGRFFEERRAVFFDRDGVINELVCNDSTEQLDSPFTWEDFTYRPGVIRTLQTLQEKGYYLFIVTNQPAAAKGKIALSQLYGLNARMVQNLKERGVSVEFVSMCPHHPTGSPKARALFLIKECRCRKPEAGMLTGLLQVYHIDAGGSYMVGDSYTDVIAGQKAGLRTVLLGTFKCDACQRLQGNRPDHIIKEIGELAQIIT